MVFFIFTIILGGRRRIIDRDFGGEHRTLRVASFPGMLTTIRFLGASDSLIADLEIQEEVSAIDYSAKISKVSTTDDEH